MSGRNHRVGQIKGDRSTVGFEFVGVVGKQHQCRHTDLFPSGFNHLTPQMLPLAVQAAMAAIEKICPEAKNLLLVPGNRTGDSFYLSSVQHLVQVFTQAGLNVRLGTLDDGVKAPTALALPDGSELVVEPILRTRGRLGLKDFDPCTILLNNDLVAGAPRALQHLNEQYLLPPLHAGWAVRLKSQHLRSYEEVAKKFAKLLGMDPWLINPLFGSTGEVDLSSAQGMEALATQADAVLTKVRRKYKEYGISDKPFVVLKANQGGDGDGILVLRDAKALDPQHGGLGARLRERLGAQPQTANTQIVVQEGVPTLERIHSAVAEPVVCMIDRYVVGGYYRVHAERGADEDLCGPGGSYVPLAFAESSQLPRPGAKPGANAPNRFYMYGVIARLAMLAASYELEATDPDAENFD